MVSGQVVWLNIVVNCDSADFAESRENSAESLHQLKQASSTPEPA
jgi:hypothetical protein